MARYYRSDDEDVVVSDNRSGSNVASNLIWAVTTLAVVGIIVWAIFFSGFFDRIANKTKKVGVDVNISAPAR